MKRYSLRTLMLMTLTCAVLAAWVSVKLKTANKTRAMIAAVELSGGQVGYKFENWLDEAGNQVKRKGWVFAKLIGDEYFNEVGVVAIEWCEISSDTLKSIAANEYKIFLYLSGSSVKDDQISLLIGSRIVGLFLDDTAVSDEAIGALKRLPHLRELVVERANFSNHGISELRLALPECDIAAK